MSQAGLNRIWAQAILETLAQSGVKHICIAPGSRSTPLSLEALELAQRSELTVHTHFDERGLGFLALGIAKATQDPVAVIVTSGTAVANLLPSVAESGLTGEKLILLTSDRPQSLIGVGANQAIVQKGIFSSHVRKSVELASPSREPNQPTPQELIQALSDINHALAYQYTVSGSLHINCPYPEPLYIQSEQEKQQYQPDLVQAMDSQRHYLELTKLYPSYNVPELTNSSQQDIINQLPHLKGVILIGKMPLDDAQKVSQWAKTLGWPIFADPQSGVSSEWAHYDLWLQQPAYFEQLSQADCVLQFGARFVSKRIGQFIKQAVLNHNCYYWVFEPNISVFNPDRLPQQRTVAAIGDCITMLENASPSSINHVVSWADKLQQPKVLVEQAASDIQQSHQLTECQLALNLSQLISLLPNAELFIGNSLIVRLADMLSTIESTQVYTNRGASGIDGLVATATGIQRSKNIPLFTLLGDTSLLYDLNSLALLTTVLQPHVVLVTNNDGGAIFDLLPVPTEQKQYLYQMPHGYQFEHAAHQFKLNYAAPDSWFNLLELVQQYLANFEQGETRSALLVEVVTPAEQASQQIKSILAKITELHNTTE
ncbi:2-succinyl-5-enolpyruvyl-6-hydroxy-3-cyclohexene-1-carboxylic-acid synthase [Vibrio algivorus]|uniref:2-succinyl-5-enolpyruvyl-6-hydroxy-3-cyclohexene-1-carboxylate synthase n=1 Tax=Vibrio algivorus TaxID=1667024 RepID=A0ABQ6ESF9_9VIBR|nr:2-succinyl-5-enolpyruvyl-6-hydroxy-3-cyclohexene-1-carboxylic-acid synthase [Vibrio algivorus]GLT15754.1 2-succinyl-5-enolpyruvyl-6-hydroxy-3-cyclohexene- 1-carboxylate synthase [Vibrio algivorus]